MLASALLTCKGRISKLEGSFASGLLEEVIGVAERELELVDTMKEARA